MRPGSRSPCTWVLQGKGGDQGGKTGKGGQQKSVQAGKGGALDGVDGQGKAASKGQDGDKDKDGGKGLEDGEKAQTDKDELGVDKDGRDATAQADKDKDAGLLSALATAKLPALAQQEQGEDLVPVPSPHSTPTLCAHGPLCCFVPFQATTVHLGTASTFLLSAEPHCLCRCRA